jgi:small subunit ribosomal protein S17
MTAETHNTTAAAPARAERRKRATQVGVVTSAARQKTIRVTVSYLVRHPKYGKYMRRRSMLHAHDEKNECRNGDLVEIVQCRPVSKTKSWRLLRIIQRGAREPVPGGQV